MQQSSESDSLSVETRIDHLALPSHDLCGRHQELHVSGPRTPDGNDVVMQIAAAWVLTLSLDPIF
jgi:hypothetical protein